MGMSELREVKGKGVVVRKNGLGVFITPADDPQAAVGFDKIGYETVPPDLKLGDEVEFTIADKKDGNATQWKKTDAPVKFSQ